MEEKIMTIIKRNIDRPFLPDWLEDFFSNDINPMTKSRVSSVPMANVYENDEEFKIELAVPGINKEDIKISVENDTLSIKCELEEQDNELAGKCIKNEYSYNSFVRAFELPEIADQTKISAKSENGILTIFVKKKSEQEMNNSQTITIQ